MSDESTHELMEPRGDNDIPTTIKTMLGRDPEPITSPKSLVFTTRPKSRALNSSQGPSIKMTESTSTGCSAAGIGTEAEEAPKSRTEQAPSRTVSHAASPAVPPASSCRSTSPLIKIVSRDEMAQGATAVAGTTAAKESSSRSFEKGKGSGSGIGGMRRRASGRAGDSFVLVKMVYNEYGELVNERTLHEPPKPEDLNVTQLLRVIKKAYHHDLRSKLGKIIVPQGDGKDAVLVESFVSKDRLTSWDFKSQQRRTPGEGPSAEASSADSHNVPVYDGPPRVLEIGCSDGAWCLNFKKEMPDWIVEGVDDTSHWSCVETVPDFTDFMKPSMPFNTEDCFSRVSQAQDRPVFTVRDINMLLNHPVPMLHNVYEFIRGREIFDRVENYRTFLDDIRLMLKPDGVVEFLEIDPRPRSIVVRREGVSEKHKSGPQTNWTDNIEDRFRDPFDEELATTVPGWTERVAAQLKATMRHRDGVAAANLTSWLEGSGFWDVKQIIIPVQVGGDSRPGQRLKEYILYQIGLEDSVPKLRDELPKVEIEAIESGTYHLNIHVVTGRKPHTPRPGDLLLDGRRQDMTESSYDAMARFKAMRVTPWKRYEIGSNIIGIMENLKSLPGAPETLSKGSEEGVSEMLQRSKEYQDALTLDEPAFLKVPQAEAGGVRRVKTGKERRKAGLSEETRAGLSEGRDPRTP